MTIQQNISLKPYNTFGINAIANYFCEINTISDLTQALQLNQYGEKYIISGGSNMLITNNIKGIVLYINIKGIEIVEENDDDVILKVMAGENWHQLVLWALKRNYGGLENMSLIPGNTGTAPIQNIGAYGVELKDTFVSCLAMNIATQELHEFSNKDCQFGYRDSYFKNSGKGKFIITSVNLKLTKKNHVLNTSYGTIESELKNQNIKKPTIKSISNAVIAIRKSKLPDPSELGNSGSFFKNPVVSELKFSTFIKNNPRAPFYKISEEHYKIPAGWLIEKCGFKGKRYGDAGVHKNQALVLVNYGEASGQDILDLSNTITKKVYNEFKIKISPEVNIIK